MIYIDRKSNVALAVSEFHLRAICALKVHVIRRDKEYALLKAANEAEYAADCNNNKELYAIVRRLAGSKPLPLAS
eukprot:1943948-Karenia_brevis.AAC.1